MLTDSHAHLDFAELRADLDGVLSRAREAGVTRVMTVSSRAGDARDVVRLARSRPELRAAVGVHPHEAAALGGAHLDELRELGREARAEGGVLRAIGEIGLDYHYDHSPREAQREAFRAQLRVAREVGLPIVVHAREADADAAAILEEEGAGEVGGVLHCFTSGRDLARRALDLGLLVSFSGIATFPRSEDLRAIARDVPLDALLVETDAPYLAPAPYRRRWPNEPALVRVTAELLAADRGITLEALAAATTANFTRVFGS